MKEALEPAELDQSSKLSQRLPEPRLGVSFTFSGSFNKPSVRRPQDTETYPRTSLLGSIVLSEIHSSTSSSP